jgi:apyrase
LVYFQFAGAASFFHFLDLFQNMPGSFNATTWLRSTNGKLTIAGACVMIVVWFLMSGGAEENSQFTIVIDAGSSGSRVHVYELRNIDGSYEVVDELFESLKPGLSSYKHDPAAAAASLDPLLQAAVDRIPAAQHSQTPIALGATAGLRMIGDTLAGRILLTVRQNIINNYDFQLRKDEDIRILDGSEEGKYAWIAVNTLLGKIGNAPSETFAACDLGGGSVQCMFAMPENAVRGSEVKAPNGYVESVTGGGRTYNLYVHSFLGYGLLAARLAILQSHPDAAAACMPNGFSDDYKYGDSTVSAKGTGDATFNKCRSFVKKALQSDQACDSNIVPDDECTIAGQWNGGLANILHKNPDFKLHLMSFFYERTKSVGAGSVGKQFDEGEDESSLAKLSTHAGFVCAKTLEKLNMDKVIHMDFPEDLPYLCMDTVYMFSFLVDGIGVDEDQEFIMEKKIQSGGKDFEAAWSLGMGMEIL